MTTDTAAQLPEGWYLVEMMGHQKLAGKVTVVPIGGAALLRVDVPEVTYAEREYDYDRGEYTETTVRTIGAFTKFVSPNSLYAITACTEAAARSESARIRVQPVHEAALPEPAIATPKALPEPDGGIGNNDTWESPEDEEPAMNKPPSESEAF